MADPGLRKTPLLFTLTALLMALAFAGLTGVMAWKRQSIPTYDQEQTEKRLKVLADLNAENQRVLTTYRWIDRGKGIVGIPIERAKQVVLADLEANKPHPAGLIYPGAAASPSQPPAAKNQAVAAAEAPPGAMAPGHPEAGKAVFKQCAVCHSVEPDENKTGPNLAGLFGRKAGTVEDFNYSDANKNSGIVWDDVILRKYLANPQSVVPGTKMVFPGLKDPQQIEDVIAYLKGATKK